jgi:hypothetical protein
MGPRVELDWCGKSQQVPLPEESGRCVKLNTHVDLVGRLRLHGAMPPRPHVFMARYSVNHTHKFTRYYVFRGRLE